MAEASIVTTRDGDIATVIIDRPEKLNAMTKYLWQSLGETIDALSRDDALRCIVLRGAGRKHSRPATILPSFAPTGPTWSRRGPTARSCIERLRR